MSTFVGLLVIALAICYFINVDWPFIAVGGSMIAAGGVILVSQMYGYLDLQKATWEPKPLLGALKQMYPPESSVHQWALDPQSMHGLHGFMQMMPLSLFLMIVGFLLCWFYTSRG